MYVLLIILFLYSQYFNFVSQYFNFDTVSYIVQSLKRWFRAKVFIFFSSDRYLFSVKLLQRAFSNSSLYRIILDSDSSQILCNHRFEKSITSFDIAFPIPVSKIRGKDKRKQWLWLIPFHLLYKYVCKKIKNWKI